jgi:hypothetical protein
MKRFFMSRCISTKKISKRSHAASVPSDSKQKPAGAAHLGMFDAFAERDKTRTEKK